MGLFSNQKGFSALEVGFFVVVMGLIGSGGYYKHVIHLLKSRIRLAP